jgi:hypothetical protein
MLSAFIMPNNGNKTKGSNEVTANGKTSNIQKETIKKMIAKRLEAGKFSGKKEKMLK